MRRGREVELRRGHVVLNLRDARPIWSIPAWAIEEIRAGCGGREVVVIGAAADGRGDGGGVSAEAEAAMAGAEVHLGFGFPERLFDAAAAAGADLRWVHSGAAGVGGALHPRMAASSVLLTNSAGIHAEPMADTVLGAIHYFARGLDFAAAAQGRGAWDAAPFEAADAPVHELAGTVVGVVGFGGIGRAVARRARALGMRVLAFRRRPTGAEEDAEMVVGEAGLERLLHEARYVVLSLPRTPETENILDARRIALLQPHAVVVNVGRGELVDEAALASALRDRAIRGAALDVFHTEPLPPHSPFWALPNVLVMPHVSAATHGFWRRQVALVVENFRRYDAREPLLNLVDKKAGY